MGVITDVYYIDKELEGEIKHEKDQVIVLDFWTTWCQPC